MDERSGFATRCIHAGEAPDPSTGAHGVPLYQNVTYAFHSAEQVDAMRAGEAPRFTYSPRGNPTVRCLELKLADLEEAETVVATASGMAAISATLLALLAGGGHVVASDEIYELTRTLLDRDLPTYGGRATFVDASDPGAIEAALEPETRAIYVEPVSNPLLRVADIVAIAEIARRRGVLLVVDNTFLSPALLRPLTLGADVVVHSATKYLSGHGQVQGGFVCGHRDVVGPIREKMVMLGGQMPPFAAWTLLAGIKTLPLRMERHGANALAVARQLAAHPAVARVNYPGLEGHPGHAVARRMLDGGRRGFGGMVSFTLVDGCAANRRFLNALSLCTIAVSLGDVGTLAWPWHGRDLIRLSVGIEDGVDLERDIAAGLAAVETAALVLAAR
jgi:methionine-gamma-lyase